MPAAVLALLLFVGGFLMPSQTHALRGYLVLDSDWSEALPGHACEGRSDLADMNAMTIISLHTPGWTIVQEQRLGLGTLRPDGGSVFTFVFPNLPEHETYIVAFGTWSANIYSSDILNQQDWRIMQRWAGSAST
jgi:hypothetical protein